MSQTFAESRKVPPGLECCGNCKHWKRREWLHCQCSGPWGGKHAMPHEPKCVFVRRAAAAIGEQMKDSNG